MPLTNSFSSYPEKEFIMFNLKLLIISFIVSTLISIGGVANASLGSGNKEPSDGENHGSPYDNVFSGTLGGDYSKDDLDSEVNVNHGDSSVNVTLESSNTTSAIPKPEIHTMLLIGLVLSGLTYNRRNNNI